MGLSSAANAVVCTNFECDASYNIVIGTNDPDVDAMFTIENNALTAWMWTEVSAVTIDYGLNDLPEAFGAPHTNLLLGTGGLAASFFSTISTGLDLSLSLDGTCFGPCGPIQIYTVAAKVPEPSTLFLFGAGLIGFAGIGLRRRRRDGLGIIVSVMVGSTLIEILGSAGVLPGTGEAYNLAYALIPVGLLVALVRKGGQATFSAAKK